jgi:hypothetical protein
MRSCLALVLWLALGLTPTRADQGVPPHYLPGSADGLIHSHLFTVPVTVGDVDSTFILDTGIGVNLISSDLAQRLKCPQTGVRFSGQRMSGQVVEMPLTWLPKLQSPSIMALPGSSWRPRRA